MSAVLERAYKPAPETRADHALTYIRAASRGKPRGTWIANTEVAAFLGCQPNAVRPSLTSAIEAGLIERSTSSEGCTQWRMAQPKARKPEVRQRFSIDWPPGFSPRFDSVVMPAYETRNK